MRKRQLQLSLLDEVYGICVFENNTAIPEWTAAASFCSITRTQKELTVVCPQNAIASDCEYDADWRCFRIDGSFDFNQIGIISSLAAPLARAGISIFVVSSYDTDYILVKGENVEQAVTVLSNNGHFVIRPGNTDNS
jgi:hypothetical protein